MSGLNQIAQPFPGFRHLTSHHCITGSLRHIYEFYHAPISEEMLLGLGAGVGFIYWHTKGALPFLGGRANIERTGVEGLEKAVGRRTGVTVNSFRTDSAARAEKMLLEQLQSGQPAMLVLDMGYLPYFDFAGQDFHFGYHVVVACGLDLSARQVLLADRDEALHPVSLGTLARARGSKYKPFPPQNAGYVFDFAGVHPPQAADILEAIQDCAKGMLTPPIGNFGVQGMHKAARRIRDWPKTLSEKELRETCINTAIMIDARGGTGGGLFRYMYGRFLGEAATITGIKELGRAGEVIKDSGDCWEQAAELFEQAYQAESTAGGLRKVCALLPDIADREQHVWQHLIQLTSRS